MAAYDEPDFRIVERAGRVGIACQHMRDDNQAHGFDGCYTMNLPEGIFDGDVKLYFCPACERRGEQDIKDHAFAYITHLVGRVKGDPITQN